VVGVWADRNIFSNLFEKSAQVGIFPVFSHSAYWACAHPAAGSLVHFESTIAIFVRSSLYTSLLIWKYILTEYHHLCASLVDPLNSVGVPILISTGVVVGAVGVVMVIVVLVVGVEVPLLCLLTGADIGDEGRFEILSVSVLEPSKVLLSDRQGGCYYRWIGEWDELVLLLR
jgi:hypothetical protein